MSLASPFRSPGQRVGGAGASRRLDRNGLEILTPEESLELLRTVRLGRIGLSMENAPVILPVTFALLEGDVVFRTGTGSKLAAAIRRTVVAFEADGIDLVAETGWSVCVTGWARAVNHPDERAAVDALGLVPFVTGPAPHAVRIHAEVATGRRLRAGR